MNKDRKGASKLASPGTPELSLDTLDQVVGGVTASTRPEDQADAAMLAVAAYTADQVDQFTPAQVAAMGVNVGYLNDDALASLNAQQVDALSAGQIHALGTHIGSLDPTAIASIDATQVNALSTQQVTALGNNIASLSNTALASLSAQQIDGLTASQVTALGAKILDISTQGDSVIIAGTANANAAWGEFRDLNALASLNGDQVKGLTADQLKALGNDVAKLAPDALGGLTAHQVDALRGPNYHPRQPHC